MGKKHIPNHKKTTVYKQCQPKCFKAFVECQFGFEAANKRNGNYKKID